MKRETETAAGGHPIKTAYGPVWCVPKEGFKLHPKLWKSRSSWMPRLWSIISHLDVVPSKGHTGVSEDIIFLK